MSAGSSAVLRPGERRAPNKAAQGGTCRPPAAECGALGKAGNSEGTTGVSWCHTLRVAAPHGAQNLKVSLRPDGPRTGLVLPQASPAHRPSHAIDGVWARGQISFLALTPLNGPSTYYSCL